MPPAPHPRGALHRAPRTGHAVAPAALSRSVRRSPGTGHAVAPAAPAGLSRSVRRSPGTGHAYRSVSRGARGQAAVELVALLPLIALLLAVAYQALLAAQAAWEAHIAARAAARANAVGAGAEAAARAHLPAGLERGLHVHATSGGDVRVSVRVPRVLPALSLGRVAATAHFRPQDA